MATLQSFSKNALNDLREYTETESKNIIKIAKEEFQKYLSYQIKTKLGKELYYEYCKDSNAILIEKITNIFIRHYDKKFKYHTNNFRSGKIRVISNSQFILKLDNCTFCYVAAGNKINNLEEKFLMNLDTSSKDLYLYIFGRNTYKYIKILEKIEKSIYNKDSIALYSIVATDNTNANFNFEVYCNDLGEREINTLFFSHGEIETVCSHIDRFNSNYDFYKKHRLNYKTGILLYGDPGTGKTSLVKALATKYNRNICSINVSDIGKINLDSITQAINADFKEYIVLLEDIDTLFLNRDTDSEDKEERKVINKLLQFLDSNSSPNNVIFIATTNHIERLDEALLRDGRFDLKLHVEPLLIDDVYRFGRKFGLSNDKIKDIIESCEKDPNKFEESFNQSFIQNRLIAARENKSIEKIEKLYEIKEQ